MLLAVDDVFFLKPIPSGAMTKYLGQVRGARSPRQPQPGTVSI